MDWEDQGRQYHMWFGHGRSLDNSKKSSPDPSVIAKTSEDRAMALVYGVIGALPVALRRRVESQYHHGTLPQLKSAMTAWLKGAKLDQRTFAALFFGRTADDPVVRSIHIAALGAAKAINHQDLRDASDKIADAIKGVGADRWPRFVADAAVRANSPLAVAAVENNQQPIDPAREAIRPVYPLETAIGVTAAGIAGGAAAAARAVGGAILRQVLPGGSPSPTAPTSAPEIDIAAASAASVREKLARYILNPDHPVGGSKAQWFKQALGFTTQNSEQLARQLVFNEKLAVQTGVTQYGTKFQQVIFVVGTNGRTIPIKTGWLRGPDGVTRLVTAYPWK